ncbi:MAG: hypothetical protein ACYCPT_07000 [Acidimicrobiales bacterium]
MHPKNNQVELPTPSSEQYVELQHRFIQPPPVARPIIRNEPDTEEMQKYINKEYAVILDKLQKINMQYDLAISY